eukprot:m.707333 g.707333  ORF g.707333 m.707333 type:complete len:255 (+) comp22935_c0_seq44:4543-5307(+)
MATTDDEHVIDHGLKTVWLHYNLNTQNLQKGETVSTHIDGESLMKGAGITHPDLLNPESITMYTESAAGKLGVALKHGPDAKQPRLSTATRALVAGVDLGDDEYETHGFHAVSLGKGIPDGHVLQLEPTADQTEKSAKNLPKRLNTTWKSVQASHMLKGVQKSTLPKSGLESRVVVAPFDKVDNTPSPIYQLLDNNKSNPKLFNGQFYGSKAKFTTVDGRKAYVMTKSQFREVKRKLRETLETKSPFQHVFDKT